MLVYYIFTSNSFFTARPFCFQVWFISIIRFWGCVCRWLVLVGWTSSNRFKAFKRQARLRQ